VVLLRAQLRDTHHLCFRSARLVERCFVGDARTKPPHGAQAGHVVDRELYSVQQAAAHYDVVRAVRQHERCFGERRTARPVRLPAQQHALRYALAASTCFCVYTIDMLRVG
jgi:hypothetical protein